LFIFKSLFSIFLRADFDAVSEKICRKDVGKRCGTGSEKTDDKLRQAIANLLGGYYENRNYRKRKDRQQPCGCAGA